MPVSSKKSQGNNSMYIQSSKTNGASSSQPPGLTRISTKIKKQDTSDSVKISAGDDFYSIYKDETLESALVTRGFSQLRPEVLGSFEFIPPLSSDSVDVSAAEGQVVYNSSGAGELIDMQNQLKQLRYAEAEYFLRVKCGLIGAAWGSDPKILQTHLPGGSVTYCLTDDDCPDGYVCVWAGAGNDWSAIFPTEQHPPDAGTYGDEGSAYGIAIYAGEDMIHNAEDDAVHIQPWVNAKLKAASVLNFLSAALTVYDLESSLDIKVNNYLDINSADSSTSAGTIAARLALYDDDFVSIKAPGSISLESYMTDFLHMPTGWWDAASNTAVFMQLIGDAASRTAYPMTDFSSFISSNGAEYGPGEILGTNKREYAAGYDAVNQLSKIDLTSLITFGVQSTTTNLNADSSNTSMHAVEMNHNTEIDSDRTGTTIFTQGDFFELWDRLVDDKDPKLFYVVARDFINHCYSAGGQTPHRTGNNQEEVLENLIGWNPFEQIANLATLQDSDPGSSLGMTAARPRDGETDVANFNKGGGDTPTGGGNITPGTEYFLSEFLAGGTIADSLTKLETFSDSLNNLTSKLSEFLDNSITPNGSTGAGVDRVYGSGMSLDIGCCEDLSYEATHINADGYAIDFSGGGGSSIPTITPVGMSSDSRGIANAGALVQRIFEETADEIYQMFITDLEWSIDHHLWGSGLGAHLLWFAAAANDASVAWKGWKYIMARDRRLKGDSDYDGSLDSDTTNIVKLAEDLLGSATSYLDMEPTGWVHKTGRFGFGYDDDGYAHEDAADAYKDLTSETDDRWVTSYPGENFSTDYDGPWFRLGEDGVYTVDDSKIFGYKYLTREDPDAGYYDSTLIPALSDVAGRALEFWEINVSSGMGADASSDSASGITTDDLGISRQGRLTMCYLLTLAIFQQTQKLAVWIPLYHEDSPGDDESWDQIKWSLSKRACTSLHDANKLKGLPSSQWNLENNEYSASDDGPWNWETGNGYKDAIEEAINLFSTFYRPQLEYDVMAWNSAYFVTEIADRVRETIGEILSAFSGELSESSMLEAYGDVTNLHDSVSTNMGLGAIATASLTRDQVRLSRYLEKTICTLNPQYQYLPSTAAINTNQAMCLGTISQLNYLLETPETGKKRIFALGLPSGMVELLRKAAADEMSSSRYNKSNVIKISLWRRNLLNETTCDTPQEFLFDMSRYVYPETAAEEFVEGQTVEELFANTSVSKFDRGGVSWPNSASGSPMTYKGQAYEDSIISGFDAEFSALENLVDVVGNANVSDSSSNALTQIFNNHVLDHYLKIYMRLTTGIDVREENFCFFEDDTIIGTTVGAIAGDADLADLKSEMTVLLNGMFDTNDIAAGITYQRISGELDRSIILSPKKYRNRIIFPKLFDRTFCILVDDADWEAPQPSTESVDTTESGDLLYENTQSEATSTTIQTDPTYFQYFVTVSIMTEVDPEDGEYLAQA